MSTCEGGTGPLEFFGGPADIESAFPANGFFTTTEDWYRAGDKVPVEFTLDADATARLGFDVFHPSNVSPDQVVFWWNDEYCARPCSYCDSYCDDNAIHFSAPDLVAPSRPVVAFRTILVSTPATSTCGDYDSLEIDLVVTDDVEPLVHLGFAVYVAPTREQVAQLTTPTERFGFRWYDEGTTYTVVLGESEGHVRDSGANSLISPDPICVAIAAFDRAGNLSERSEITCLDTNDETDPSVVWVDESMYSSSGCCDAGAGAGPASALLAAVVALALRGTGRARRRDRT